MKCLVLTACTCTQLLRLAEDPAPQRLITDPRVNLARSPHWLSGKSGGCASQAHGSLHPSLLSFVSFFILARSCVFLFLTIRTVNFWEFRYCPTKIAYDCWSWLFYFSSLRINFNFIWGSGIVIRTTSSPEAQIWNASWNRFTRIFVFELLWKGGTSYFDVSS